MATETTLILFKPDAVQKNLVGEVLARFQKPGFRIRGIKMLHLCENVLRDHYAHVVEQPFYPKIQKFMLSTPIIALALEGPHAIVKVREILGATNPAQAAPGTVRADFGTDMMVNVCHASDSVESAEIELKRFFNENELFA